MGKAYAPSRFMWKNLGTVHHGVVLQGAQKSASRPHPQRFRAASAHIGHAAVVDDQPAMQLFHNLLPQTVSLGPAVVLKGGHGQNSFGETGQYSWDSCMGRHVIQP